MSRHARENPEKYEDRDYSYANDVLRQADELREERKLAAWKCAACYPTLCRCPRRPAPGGSAAPKKEDRS